MIKINLSCFATLFVFTMLYSGCIRDNGGVQYDKLVKSEIANGKRVDSIFWGIHFGMTGKEFFAYCWEMNKKGLFTDGESNTAVLYHLDHNELDYPASMNFYPDFDQNKIAKMGATFKYDGWAPWNKQMFSDKLLTDVLHLYQKWYPTGNPFLEIKKSGKNTIYVKVDGNRRIILGIQNDVSVKADYTNLLAGK